MGQNTQTGCRQPGTGNFTVSRYQRLQARVESVALACRASSAIIAAAEWTQSLIGSNQQSVYQSDKDPSHADSRESRSLHPVRSRTGNGAAGAQIPGAGIPVRTVPFRTGSGCQPP